MYFSLRRRGARRTPDTVSHAENSRSPVKHIRYVNGVGTPRHRVWFLAVKAPAEIRPKRCAATSFSLQYRRSCTYDTTTIVFSAESAYASDASTHALAWITRCPKAAREHLFLPFLFYSPLTPLPLCDPFVMTSITAVRIAVRPKGGLRSGARRVPPQTGSTRG